MIKALGFPSNNLSLKRVVDSQGHEAILLRETIGIRDAIKNDIKGLLFGWDFVCVKFVNHWYTRKWEKWRRENMQWNNQGKCTLNSKFMPQISDKTDKNWSVNHNINIHSLISNTMVLQYIWFICHGSDSNLPTHTDYLVNSMHLNHCWSSLV